MISGTISKATNSVAAIVYAEAGMKSWSRSLGLETVSRRCFGTSRSRASTSQFTSSFSTRSSLKFVFCTGNNLSVEA